MAFKLNKDEVNLRAKLVSALDASGATLNDTVAEFNAMMLREWEKVLTAQEQYNKIVADAQQFVESVHALRMTEFDEKSETWADSDTGQAVSNWLEEWETVLDDCDLESPEPVDVGDLASVGLGELPTEPSK